MAPYGIMPATSCRSCLCMIEETCDTVHVMVESMMKVLCAGVMELVAMELKQAGFFLARTLSYEVHFLH
jgi:hypothetical protein